MRKFLVIGILVGMGVPLQASMSDYIIGVVLITNGGTFEYLRGKASSDRESAAKKASESAILTVQADENYYLYTGAAATEFFYFGNSSTYRALTSTAETWRTATIINAASLVKYASEASDKQDQENIYKGVSLTTFAIGGAFLIKGIASSLINKSQTTSAKKYRWAKNIDLSPSPQMDGAELVYNYRF